MRSDDPCFGGGDDLSNRSQSGGNYNSRRCRDDGYVGCAHNDRGADDSGTVAETIELPLDSAPAYTTDSGISLTINSGRVVDPYTLPADDLAEVEPFLEEGTQALLLLSATVSSRSGQSISFYPEMTLGRTWT